MSEIAPTTRTHLLAAVARAVLWTVASFWLITLLIWGVLHAWIVPRIGDFRPRLEAVASQAVGVPVRIGQLTAKSTGLFPSIELRDVALLDPQGREALRLPRVLAALSPSSVLGAGFEQLVIDQPALDVRRTADGKIYVGGLEVSAKSSGGNGVGDWFFSQAEFVIRSGSVRWTDELNNTPPLTLEQVDVVMRNGSRRHAMRLDATPPSGWGDRFSLRGLFRQPLLALDAGKWQDWSGQLFADFSRVDMSLIVPYVELDTLGIKPKSGSGSLRAWADIEKGKVSGATADVVLSGIDVQLGKSLQPLTLTSAAGRLGAQLLDDGFAFNTEGLTFTTRDGLTWPGGNVAFSSQGTKGVTAVRSELKADRLNLAALTQVALRLPLSTATHAAIASFAPKGLVEAVQARWEEPITGELTYNAKGRVSSLELAALPSTLLRPLRVPAAPTQASTSSYPQVQHPQPGRPGIKGATFDFDMSHVGGKGELAVLNGHIDLPGVFEDPRVVFDQLSAGVRWKLSSKAVEVALQNVKFSGPDAQGTAQATWQSATESGGQAGTPSEFKSLGTLDLQGLISRGDGARVHRYLPLVMADQVRHYVRDAVVQGDLSNVSFKVKGAVDKIPYPDAKVGEFKISAQVKNGVLAYVPAWAQPPGVTPWPALTALNGELVFDRVTLAVNNATSGVAGMPGLQVLRADARIPNLTSGATVELQAKIKGPVSSAVSFVNSSPLAAMTSNAAEKINATGLGDYAVQLNLPLNAVDKTTVRGTVSLPGNDVRLSPTAPVLTKLRGVATFTEKSFSVPLAQAQLLGGDVRFEGGLRPASRAANGNASTEPSVVFKAQGTATAEAVRLAKDLGAAARLAQYTSGSTAYTATLGITRGVMEVSLASNLQGLALSLPAPLTKTAEAQLPVRFETSVLRESMGDGQKLQDQLSVSIGRLASANYVRDISGDASQEARVVRGTIGIGLEAGESAPLIDKGIAANINLASIDIDAWEKVLANSAGSSLAAQASAGGGQANNSQSYFPTQIAIRAKELTVTGRKFNNLVIGGSRDGLTWRANVDANELSGYAEYRQAANTVPARVLARLARLNVGPTGALEVDSLIDEQPANLPALDIVVDELELRGKKLGRIEIDAVNRGAGTAAGGSAREWRLNKFNVINAEATLTASGNWVALNVQAGPAANSPDKRRTALNFKLDIADSGELLNRFGMRGVVRRGKGKMEGQIGWVGSPLSPNYPSMTGQFNVNIESGQFLKADPGIAKLLGVLSLQSLPRRLALDFRDVFTDGFSFDFVRGDVNIAQGIAATNNLQMKGVNAAVLMEGSANIAKETQDLKVLVVPEINAGTASLIAAVINPAIGLGTFLAQFFLRQPLIEAATQEFQIDGSWADPKVTKLERKR